MQERISRGDLLPYFSDSNLWIEVGRRNASYCKIIILKERDVARRAFFKFKDRRYGCIAANERLAYEFGVLLNLPVAEVQFLNWDGMDGVVSHCIPGREPLEWRFLPQAIRKSAVTTFRNGRALQYVGIFDAWICNTDRHEDNLMFSRDDEGICNFYMIDHGLGFLGETGRFSQSAWNDPAWLDLGRFLRIEDFPAYMTTSTTLDAFNDKIKSLDTYTLTRMVNSLPDNYIGPEERKTTISLLCDRQRIIDVMLRRWIDKVGKH